MFTVSNLAERAGLSRTSVLYYEREGLLLPAARAANGYRLYSDKELDRLQLIVNYRALGLPVAEIRVLLDRDAGVQQKILQRQLVHLQGEIERLQQQQRTIVSFLEQPESEEKIMVSKERWTAIMRASGMTDEDMRNWHVQFEKLEPQGHQEFLESLKIDAEEIKTIRQWSKEG
ncbi:MerR family transcriptional regulator [Amphritea sp. HPY]|uniref:MerR family transcriptional regulator n=1 Tax=Amphritea sp. HPY TaxID=3421652 RepID=UPI003D7EF78F